MSRVKCLRIMYLCLVFACLSSCAGLRSSKRAAEMKPVYVTNRSVYSFLAPGAIEAPMDGLQLLEGAYGDKEFNLLVYVKADSTSTVLIMLNDFGSEIARVTYTSEGTETSGVMAKSGLQVEYILADFQFGYFQAKELTSRLADSGLTFKEYSADDAVIREIWDGDSLIMRISRTGTGLELRNFLRGYTYRITYKESI